MASDARMQQSLRHKIDFRIKLTGQLLLEILEFEKVRLRRVGVSILEEKVNVGIGSGVPSGYRSEQVQCFDSARAQLGLHWAESG